MRDGNLAGNLTDFAGATALTSSKGWPPHYLAALFISPREQAPGPQGSPQDPQAPLEDADAEGDEPFADTAKTES